jgi:hypothetical protein
MDRESMKHGNTHKETNHPVLSPDGLANKHHTIPPGRYGKNY